MMKLGKLGARSPRLTRRQVLRTAAMGAVAVAGFASPAIAQQRNISFTLPWVPEGPNLNSFVAKANGYWSKAISPRAAGRSLRRRRSAMASSSSAFPLLPQGFSRRRSGCRWCRLPAAPTTPSWRWSP